MAQQQDLTPILRDWLCEPDELPPPRIAEMGSLVHETTQQRGLVPPFPRRFQPMFSATKFVVAGAIVALFGGFLLSGVLTQQPSDEPLPPAAASASPEVEVSDQSVRSDILPGVDLVTEEVEPGFLRVLSDGVRDLTQERTARIVHGQDGSVWLFRDKAFFRLGDPATHERPNDKRNDAADPRNADDIEVGPDGVVWWADPGGKGLWSFDGEAWTLRREKPSGPGGEVDEVEVLPDGTVLASWKRDRGRRKVARVDADGWEIVKDIDGGGGGIAVLDTNDAGDVWLQLSSTGPDIHRLYRGRYEDGSEIVLRRVKLPSEGIFSVRLIDGTVWADAWGPILRFDGATWTEDAYPGGHAEGGWPVESTPDGQLWYASTPDVQLWYDSSCEAVAPDQGDAYLRGCDLVHFDGQTANRFELDDSYGYSRVVAPDGTLWLVLDAEQGGGLYVITPRPSSATASMRTR